MNSTLIMQIADVIAKAKTSVPATPAVSLPPGTVATNLAHVDLPAAGGQGQPASQPGSAVGTESAPSSQHVRFDSSESESIDMSDGADYDALDQAEADVQVPAAAELQEQVPGIDAIVSPDAKPGSVQYLQTGADGVSDAQVMPNSDERSGHAASGRAGEAVLQRQTSARGSSEAEQPAGHMRTLPAPLTADRPFVQTVVGSGAEQPRRKRVRMQATSDAGSGVVHTGGLASVQLPVSAPARRDALAGTAHASAASVATKLQVDDQQPATGQRADAGLRPHHGRAPPHFDLPLVGVAAPAQAAADGAAAACDLVTDALPSAAEQHRKHGTEVLAAVDSMRAANAAAGASGAAATAAAAPSGSGVTGGTDIPSSIRERYGSAPAVKRQLEDLFDEDHSAAAAAGSSDDDDGGGGGRLGDVTTLLLKSDKLNRGRGNFRGRGRGRGGSGSGERHTAPHAKRDGAFVGFNYPAEQAAAQADIAKRARPGGGRGSNRGRDRARGAKRPTSGFNPFEVQDAAVPAPSRNQSRGGNKSAVL